MVFTQRRQYTRPDSIKSASTFSARSDVLPLLRCALTSLRYSLGISCQKTMVTDSKFVIKTYHAFQAMSDVDRMFVPSIGPTTIAATLPSSMPSPAWGPGWFMMANLISYIPTAGKSSQGSADHFKSANHTRTNQKSR